MRHLMELRTIILTVAAVLTLAASTASGHPASGIVVDNDGPAAAVLLCPHGSHSGTLPLHS
jgi:hypothetical protein